MVTTAITAPKECWPSVNQRLPEVVSTISEIRRP
jgi:hypothetical protein